jgi:hypothetical protein
VVEEVAMFFRFPPDIRWNPEHPSDRLISALDANTFTPARAARHIGIAENALQAIASQKASE